MSFKRGRKWAKPERLKTTPVTSTPLMLEILSYGFSCQEYGKWSCMAIKEKAQKGPKQKEYWALMFKAQETMEEKLKSIATGWPTHEPHGNYVAPLPEEQDNDEIMATEDSEAVQPSDLGSGPNEVGEVEPGPDRSDV